LGAKFEAEGPDVTTDVQALGIALHLLAEEMLRTLNRTGERQIPSQELVEIMYELLGRPECPHLSDRQIADLRIMALQLAAHEWTAERLVAVEGRLFCDVPCPDGKDRTITGSPDALLADPPAAAIVLDYKSGWAAPPAPRDGDWDKDQGRAYLSERGIFQLDTYGLLVMRNYPAIERVLLREFHVRIDETREAHLERDELEHVERRLGVLAQRLDEVLAGEAFAEARPGSHCTYCPRPHECPIPWQDRHTGKITNDDQARYVAEMLAPLEGVRKQDIAALKAYLDKDGKIEFGNGSGYYGWKTYESGKKSFGLHTGSP